MRSFLSGNFVNHDVAVGAAVVDNLLERRGKSAGKNIDADLLIAANVRANLIDRFTATKERDAAAGKNSFERSRAGRMERVVNAILLLLHLCFGMSANFDDRDAAAQFRKAFLEFFAIVIAFAFRDHAAQQIGARFDLFFGSATVNNRRGVLVDRNTFRAAKLV